MSKAVVDFRKRPGAFKEMSEMSYGRIRDIAEDTVMHSRDQAMHGSYEPKPPHKTGHNADHIAMQQLKEGEFIVFTHSGYGGWLHIGTQKMPPRPYIRDGYRLAVKAAERRG